MAALSHVRPTGLLAAGSLAATRGACICNQSSTTQVLDDGMLLFHRHPFLGDYHGGSWMPRMIPPNHGGDAPDSERRLFVELERQLPATGTAFHARTVVEAGSGTEGGIDFLVAAPDRGLLLFLNRLLAETLALDVDSSVPEASEYEVSTLHVLSERLSKEAGLAWGLGAAKDVQRIFREESIGLLLAALDRLPKRRWDPVVIDEGQDFLAPWWVAVESLLSGAKAGRLWALHGPAQSIFGGEVPIDDLRLVRQELPWNCRNTRRIAERAAKLTGEPLRCRTGAPEGEPSTERTARTDDEMLDAVRKSLHELVKGSGFSLERTLVLTAASFEKSRIWKQRGRHPAPLVRYSPKTPPKRGEFPISSLSAFKGLEADAGALCEIRPGSQNCTPAHLAVGATRAKHGLAVAQYGDRGAAVR